MLERALIAACVAVVVCIVLTQEVGPRLDAAFCPVIHALSHTSGVCG